MKKLLGWGTAVLLSLMVIGGISGSTEKIESNIDVPAGSVTEQLSENIGSSEVKAEPIVQPEPVPATPPPTPQPIPQPTPTPRPNPTPAPSPAPAASSCDPNYTPCVPNVSYDLDCSDISFSVTVTGTDHHKFDRDNDGHGCESN